MSLKDTLNLAAQQAFSVLGSVLEEITYVANGTESYDASTGVVSIQGTVEYTFKASLTSYKDHEIDFKVVQPKDRRCVFLVRDLPVAPKLTDNITTSEGMWDIIAIKREFSSSVHTLQVRRP